MATSYGPACPQPAPASEVPNQNEDCLYLNVYAPLDARAGDNRPVYLYWHGGAFKDRFAEAMAGAEAEAWRRMAGSWREAIEHLHYPPLDVPRRPPGAGPVRAGGRLDAQCNAAGPHTGDRSDGSVQ